MSCPTEAKKEGLPIDDPVGRSLQTSSTFDMSSGLMYSNPANSDWSMSWITSLKGNSQQRKITWTIEILVQHWQNITSTLWRI